VRTDTRALRERAARSLSALYTPEVCRVLRTDPKDGSLIAPLFGGGWPLAVMHLLEVGLDLDEVTLVGAGPVTKRLLVEDQFRDAAFELRVWASLCREGYSVTRVREGQAKTPDYVVKRDGLEVDVEVKMANESDPDNLAADINSHVASIVDVIPGLALRFVGDEALGARLLDRSCHQSLKEQREAIAGAFRAAAQAIKQSGSAPGRYAVPGLGEVQARATSGHPSLTPDLFPQQSDEKKAQRVLRQIRSAAQQASKRRPLVCVVGVFHKANLVAVEHELRGCVARDGKSLQPCEMVVLVDMVRNNLSDYSSTRLSYPLAVRKNRELTKAQLRLARAAAGSHRGPAELIRGTRPGETGLPLGPTRRATTKVLLRQLSADPTSPIAFSPLDVEDRS